MKSKLKKLNRRPRKTLRQSERPKRFSAKNRARHKPERKPPRSTRRVRPRTLKQFFSLPEPAQELWNLVVQVPARMRSENASLRKVARELGLTPKQVLRSARSAFRRLRNGRYVAKATDRLLRILVLPSDKGLFEVAVNDSRQATVIGEYWNAVHRYLSTGDASELERFRKKRIKTASGKRISLLTDVNELRRQASAGVLRFESLYGRTA
jgi:hypothetical protein